jgi:chitin synthase
MEKTVHSIYDNNYPDHKKLIFIVVDGINKVENREKTTAEITLNLFGRSLSEKTQEYKYSCVHETENYNYARVFSGKHLSNGHDISYIVVVKCGNKSEKINSRRGNRGKRDSQLILLNFLSKNYYGKRSQLSELDNELYDHILNRLDLCIDQYKFLLTIDADTEADSEAIRHMVYRMSDPKIYALCGETQISNKLDSWVTSIQVYEYYYNHNSSKAFESFFGSVTCLPGCFSMYRIKTECKREKPIIIYEKLLEEYSDNIVNTLHKKSLLQLGEDRYHTTLLTKYFPKAKFKYIIEAKCKTTVPKTCSELFRQRRRWVNSTIHNLFKLMFVKRMCGVCCCSMKCMVFLDLIVTYILPASCSYLFYLIYAFSSGIEPVNVVFITMMAVTIGAQILIFVIKRNFIYIIWLILYLLALPIWMILIPTYSFFKSDDFTWGTRDVKNDNDEEKKEINIESLFVIKSDTSEILENPVDEEKKEINN